MQRPGNEIIGHRFAEASVGGLLAMPNRATWWRARDTGHALAFTVMLGIMVVGGLIALGWFSLHLAGTRIYQVDEAGNVLGAWFLATHQSVGGQDWFPILLSWTFPKTMQAADLFSSARLFMVVVFWSNWLLIACATGERVFSRRWLVALLAAATLAPLWDYGFEARHDNLLLAGILLMWTAVRFSQPKWQVHLCVGACVVGLQYLASKSFVYTVPIAFLALVFRSKGENLPRWKAFLACMVGGALAYLAVHLVFNRAGLGGFNLAAAAVLADVPKLSRFWAWDITLPRLLIQTPLLLALTLAAVFSVVMDLVRDAKATLNWDGILPEALLVGIAMGALLVNPNPYPYNLVNLVPYAFLLAFRYAGTVLGRAIWGHRVLLPVAVAIIVFAHLVPFGVATKRHLERTNARQETMMKLAERATDPKKDPVFDAIGMVPTRPIVDHRAFIHGQGVKQLINGGGPQIRDLLAANPPAVIIPSYRTAWLPGADHDYIRGHYVSVSDDFWVLGTILPPDGGTFTIIREGRYRISTLADSDLTGTYPEGIAGLVKPEPAPALVGTLDGVKLSNSPVSLAPGTHRISVAPGCQVAVVWVGPQMDRLGRHGKGDHLQLFYNWY